MRTWLSFLLLTCGFLAAGGADLRLVPDAFVPSVGSLKQVALPGEGGGWAFLKEASKQRLLGTLPKLPAGCGGVRVAVSIALPEGADAPERAESVWAVQLTQEKKSAFEGRTVSGVPVRTLLPRPGAGERSVVLESYYPVDPALPLKVQLERLTSDPADTFPGTVLVTGVTVSPLPLPVPPVTVVPASGYNSWPFIQAVKGHLVCAYSRGTKHSIDEPERGAYVRVSENGGRVWGPEKLLVNTPDECEVVSSKGLDENGDLLLWVRCRSKKEPRVRFDLYRSADGEHFEKIAVPKLSPVPMQIMDVVRIPGKGLMCLWFAGNYKEEDGSHCWGTLFSRNNGLTWEQKTVESGLKMADWPTEPSAVWLGNGRILAIGRAEGKGGTTNHAQFQLQSGDFGATWSKLRTNVTDVRISTPSLIYDGETGLLSCYYFFRGRGILNRRVVRPDSVWNRPLNWSAPETVALGKPRMSDSGNVNAVASGDGHLLAYYMGDRPDTSVVVAARPAPGRRKWIVLDKSNLTAMGGNVRSSFSSERSALPIWYFLKLREQRQPRQRVGGVVDLPANCGGVRVEAELVIPSDIPLPAGTESVWMVQLKQQLPKGAKTYHIVESAPVRVHFPRGVTKRRVLLESFGPVKSTLPMQIRVERITSDPVDTCPGDVGLTRLFITPLETPSDPGVVEHSIGYNGWPLLQPFGKKLICIYSRGKGHFVTDPDGNSYRRISEDGGLTWGPEACTFNYATENVGVTGLGLDEKGALLCWTRAWGEKRAKRHELYRSIDGTNFEKIAEPKLDPLPMQIMKPVRIPGKGLLSLWFAGNYKQDDGSQCWGTLFSRDNGVTWEQKTVESGLTRAEWPTEPSIVYLGNGHILGLGRVEGRSTGAGHALFQLQSSDYGATWVKTRTNITDVRISTPSLIYDPVNGYVHCYYFYRGRGLLNRRSAFLRSIWNHPLDWNDPETVALGRTRVSDSGNVCAVAVNDDHVLAYYMGNRTDTAVLSVIVPGTGESAVKTVDFVMVPAAK